MSRRAIFLDRDGTVNVEVDFLSDPDDVRLEEGAGKALRLLGEAGFALIVVTNQSGVARGYHGEDDVRAVNHRIEELLKEEGVAIEGFYHCPHHPEGTVERFARVCDCRKPAPGLLLKAAGDLGVDMKASYIIGDSARDLEAGRRAGVGTVLVRTGYGARAEAGVLEEQLADFIADDILAAAEWIVSRGSSGGADVER